MDTVENELAVKLISRGDCCGRAFLPVILYSAFPMSPAIGGRGRGIPPPRGWSGTMPHLHGSPRNESS